MHAPSAAGRPAGDIVGVSAATVRLRAHIEKVAPFSSNVLITGPSGTGKELVARRLHARSPRADRPFVPLDCASITGELMASQLFGHVAGAFTGAHCDALGCFRAANHGTLFLDEIGELEYPLQAKLLRVLQERVVTPVGSHRGEPIDVRVVAATNRDLREEVAAGRFREDLYYRLHVVHLQTAPLRQRAEDIPLIAEAFLVELAAEGLPKRSLSAAALAELSEYAWPGNVRELRNVLEQAVIRSDASVLRAEDVAALLQPDAAEASGAAASGDQACATRPRVHSPADQGSPGPEPLWASLAAVEREHLLRTLAHTFYNRSAAARLLGITRQALLRKMQRHRIDVPSEQMR
ncbi:MAG: sigma-54-dependent Fis family transcriptional regulator [Planctomycetota bacterium]|nr:MAG: sigma-54-dependent Fis family transcriptional regulator [Planctomycetota bacterium]